MNKASYERLVQELSLHDVSQPHKRNGRPCFCRLAAERTIRDIERAGFEIKDVRPREGEIEVNIHIDNASRFCPNCGSPVSF